MTRIRSKKRRSVYFGCFVGSLGLIALATATAHTAFAIDLLQPELTSGSHRALQEAGGTVRLEAPRIAPVERRAFDVPEAKAVSQISAGAAALALSQIFRRRRVRCQSGGSGVRDAEFEA
jgi:hypothetical protein